MEKKGYFFNMEKKGYLDLPNIAIECFQNTHKGFEFLWGFSYENYNEYRCCYKGYNILIYDYYKSKDDFKGWFVSVINIFVGVAAFSADLEKVLLKCLNTLDNLKEDNFNELKLISLN